MRTTIIGRVADRHGFARQTTAVQGRTSPELRRHHFAVRGDEYRCTQPERIPLELEHGRRIGLVLHLERRHGNLWAVAEIDNPHGITPGAVYFSPTIEHEQHGCDAIDVEMRSLSLVAHPATIGAPAVHELLGDVRAAHRDAWRLRNRFLTELLGNAVSNKNGTTRIVEDHPPDQTPTLFERRMTGAPRAGSGQLVPLPDGTLAELEYTAPHYGGVTIH